MGPTSVDELELRLSEPTPHVLETFSQFPGDLIVLGAGGKMGPSLCRMARRAADDLRQRRRIFAVSRFTDAALIEQLRQWDVEPIRGDLLDRAFLASLPTCPLVVSMSGMKFGSSRTPSYAWAMNALLPSYVCERFRSSRIVAFSTGNVYPLVEVDSCRGSLECDPLAPVGEYAMTCLGRERIFDYCSRLYSQPVALIRLNYAAELRYGVLVDIALQVARRQRVSLTMGYVNVIWQADANAHALASLALADCPPFVLNVTGPEILQVRDVAAEFGRLLGVPVTFTGEEPPTALLNDASQAERLFGSPRVDPWELMEWIAAWIRAEQPLWDKPTHFETRHGRF